MSERLVKVKLYGHLRKFGREFEVSVKSPAEAVHALGVMIPGFKHFLETAELKGMAFAVFNGKQNITAEELRLGAKPEIRIAPIYGGRKSSGGFSVILGVALMAIAVVATGGVAGLGIAGAAGWGGALSAGGFAGALAMTGFAMAIGGVIQMLTPTASTGLKTSADSENTSAYAFGGPVNTTSQGTPVGILYGEREIGGAVISAGIFAEDRA
jgi:predicted phage tail protein